MSIFTPMTISIAPPIIPAPSPSLEEVFRPRYNPVTELKNVIAAIIKDAMSIFPNSGRAGIIDTLSQLQQPMRLPIPYCLSPTRRLLVFFLF